MFVELISFSSLDDTCQKLVQSSVKGHGLFNPKIFLDTYKQNIKMFNRLIKGTVILHHLYNCNLGFGPLFSFLSLWTFSRAATGAMRILLRNNKRNYFPS